MQAGCISENADSKSDGKLFSDNASRADMVSHIVNTRLLPLTLVFLCCILPGLFLIFGNESRLGNILGYCIGGLFVIFLMIVTYCSIKLKKSKKSMMINLV